MKIKILNKVWDLVWVKRGHENDHLKKGEDGACEAPYLTHKKIYLRKNLHFMRMIEAAIHEMLHAADWSKDEEWVHDTAHDVTRELLRILRANATTKQRCISCAKHCKNCTSKTP